MKFFILISMLLVIIAGCAGTGGGLGSISKTNHLSPGMDVSEVRKILGSPSQTQFVANNWVWKYSLHQYMKGWVPYYLVFDKKSKKLEEWYADEAEYIRNQKLWMQAFPPKQNVNINVR